MYLEYKIKKLLQILYSSKRHGLASFYRVLTLNYTHINAKPANSVTNKLFK